MTELFRTVHGSHLYGMAHEGSDMDLYIVTDSQSSRARQTVVDGIDTVRIGLDTFLAYASGGSHQSCEALFSRKKEWTPEGKSYRPMIESYRVYSQDVVQKYERTIVKFSFGNFKRRRHAVRLSFNLAELRNWGKFDPTMTEEQIKLANFLAECYTGEDLLPWLLHRNWGQKNSQDLR
jgi:hypothetical protein